SGPRGAPTRCARRLRGAGRRGLGSRWPEGPPASRGRGARRRPGGWSQARSSPISASERDPDRQRCASARGAFREDLAPVLLDDLVGNRQAEAAALADRLGRKERLENATDDVGANPRPSVADRDDSPPVLDSRLDDDLATALDGLRRVGQDVEEDLVDLRTDALDRRHLPELPMDRD